MAIELAGYDYTKVEWVENNCTQYDFVKKCCYQKFKNYNDWLIRQNNSGNSSEETQSTE